MSRTRKRARAPEDGEKLRGAFLVRRGLGHSVVWVELPADVVDRYAVEATAPDIRANVAGHVLRWVETAP